MSGPLQRHVQIFNSEKPRNRCEIAILDVQISGNPSGPPGRFNSRHLRRRQVLCGSLIESVPALSVYRKRIENENATAVQTGQLQSRDQSARQQC